MIDCPRRGHPMARYCSILNLIPTRAWTSACCLPRMATRHNPCCMNRGVSEMPFSPRTGIGLPMNRTRKAGTKSMWPHIRGLSRSKVSTGGGCNPAWSGDGKELFYLRGDKMIAVSIETDPELRSTGSEVLFEGKYSTDSRRNYDVSGDGRRFLMVKESEDQPAATQLIVVLNWFEELKRLVPTGKK